MKRYNRKLKEKITDPTEIYNYIRKKFNWPDNEFPGIDWPDNIFELDKGDNVNVKINGNSKSFRMDAKLKKILDG
jgi:hypothetical protein